MAKLILGSTIGWLMFDNGLSQMIAKPNRGIDIAKSWRRFRRPIKRLGHQAQKARQTVEVCRFVPRWH